MTKQSSAQHTDDCSTIHSSPDIEATEMALDRGMDKEDVVHVCNKILLSHKKNEIIPFVTPCMNLEIIILSEVSQKEKGKYHMITHMWNLSYNTNELINETDRHRLPDTENKGGCQEGVWGEG